MSPNIEKFEETRRGGHRIVGNLARERRTEGHLVQVRNRLSKSTSDSDMIPLRVRNRYNKPGQPSSVTRHERRRSMVEWREYYSKARSRSKYQIKITLQMIRSTTDERHLEVKTTIVPLRTGIRQIDQVSESIWLALL